MRLRGGELLWMDQSDREHARAIARCAAVAVSLYGQRLGKVDTQRSSNVKVRCWLAPAAVTEQDAWADGPTNGIDFVNLVVDPAELAADDWPANRRVLVRWFHEGVLRAATHWGWPTGPFEDALASVEAHGYDLVWESPTKASPDHRHRAVGRAFMDENGGTTRLDVVDGSGNMVASAEGGPLRTVDLAEAKVRFKTIQWADARNVVAEAGPLVEGAEPTYPPIAVSLD